MRKFFFGVILLVVSLFGFGVSALAAGGPILSNDAPKGVLPADTTVNQLTFSTNVPAVCKGASTAGVSFNLMDPATTTILGTSHVYGLPPLIKSTSYAAYFRCRDAAGNTDTTDYKISFSVAGSVTSAPIVSPVPTPAPRISAFLTASVLADSSTAPQFIATGSTGITNGSVAVFNFKSNTPTTISELKFGFHGTSAAIGATSVPVVDGFADFTGLKISVPSGNTGIDVPVSLSYLGFDPGDIASDGATSSIFLVRVLYSSNGSNGVLCTSLETTSSCKHVLGPVGIVSPAMMLVASKPEIQSIGGTVIATNGEVLLGSVKISADPKGDILIHTIPLTITSAGNAIASGNIIVKNAADQSVIATLDGLNVPAGSSEGVTIKFTAGYTIPAGTSTTFDIYTSVTGASSSPLDTVSMKLGPADSFSWTDITVGDSATFTSENASYLLDYPSDGSFIF